MKIRELLTDESKWTQGAGARNKYGKIVSVIYGSGICWCLSGAARKCYPDERDYNNIRDRIYREIQQQSITRWNDDSDRTFEEVKELVEKLDI